MIENNKIRASVALCTYNGIDYIEQQLESIINQTQPVNEIIICDDRSTDATLSILKDFKKKYPKIITYLVNDDKLYTKKNFERSVSLTTGDYIFLCDQDDIWEPNKVEHSINYFRQNKSCLMLFTNASLIDSEDRAIEGDLWDKWNFNTSIQKQWLDPEFQIKSLIQNINKVTGATVVFNKILKDDIIPINLPNEVWHDCFFALHAAKKKGLHFIDEKLIKYRIHDQQQIGIGNENSIETGSKINYNDYRKYLEKDFKEYLKFYDKKYSSITKKRSNRNIFRSKIMSFFNFINK